jgi:group I intron endonuclease
MSKPYGVVYCLTFPDGKKYFGGTKRFLPRMNIHKHSAKEPKAPVSMAISNFGWENIKREVVSECSDRQELLFMESWFISLYDTIKNGYNIQRGTNPKLDEEEVYKRRSLANKGKKRTQELKDRMRGIFLKKKEAGEIYIIPEDEKEKWSEMNRGKNNPSYNSDEFVFQHKRTGEVFRGTRYEFRLKANTTKTISSGMATGRLKSFKGWVVTEGPLQTQVLAKESQEKTAPIFSIPKEAETEIEPQIFENQTAPILEAKEENFIWVGDFKVSCHARRKITV